MLGTKLVYDVIRIYGSFAIFLVKLFGRRPKKHYKWEPMKEDVELRNYTYPMVLVQVPMYNEREVNAVGVFTKTSDGACYLALKSEGGNMQV